MIIRPDGTTETTESSDVSQPTNGEAVKQPATEVPHLEERPMVEEDTRRRQEDTQAIIARIIGNPLA